MRNNVRRLVQRASKSSDRASARAAQRSQDIRAGRRADDEGRYQFDKILRVDQTRGGAIRFLVRWQSDHDDSWCSYGQIGPAYRHVARRWAWAVLGRRIKIEGGAGWEPVGTRIAARRMRRLLRGADVGVAATSTVGREHADVGDLGCERRVGVKWRRVVMDDIEEGELRGEAWRDLQASNGRKVRKRQSVASRMPPPI